MVLTFPTSVLVSGEEFGLTSNGKTFVSPTTGSSQSVTQLGARWMSILSIDIMNETMWRDLSAFLAEMDGMVGRVYLGPFHAQTASGSGGGTPLVQGGSQTGKSLITDGWPNSTLVLRRGDYFHFDTSTGRELKQVKSNVTSNGSGVATITFEPSIRVSPADNAAITISSPNCIMMMMDGEYSLRFMPPALGSTTLKFVEAFSAA